MKIDRAVKSAEQIILGLNLDFLEKGRLKIDRVHDNPEAGRYFMMFAEWDKIEPGEIFSTLDKKTAKDTQIYVDFVYCKKLCDFCAFYGVVPKNAHEISSYVDCLKKEILMIKKIYFDQGFKANALEYGGGTPTFLPLNLLKDVTQCILGEFPFIENHEFNFEASPETLVGDEGIQKLKYLKSSGANRMSIGVQSFDEKILLTTNRPHNLKDIHESIKNSQAIGFERINIDLMLGLSEQTIENFLDSIQKTIDYNVEIVELYTMRYFDTKEYVLSKNKLNKEEGFWPLRDILTARIAADIILTEAGYKSNNGRTYEKNDSTHNFYADYYEGNFKAKNTLGLGRKSNSNVYPWQYANYRNMDKYQNAVNHGRLPIAAGTHFTEDQKAAKILTGMFQLDEWIKYSAIRASFSADKVAEYDELFNNFVNCGLLEEKEESHKKTLLGFLFVEEMLKKVYDIVVTPYNSSSLFLGKNQVG